MILSECLKYKFQGVSKFQFKFWGSKYFEIFRPEGSILGESKYIMKVPLYGHLVWLTLQQDSTTLQKIHSRTSVLAFGVLYLSMFNRMILCTLLFGDNIVVTLTIKSVAN